MVNQTFNSIIINIDLHLKKYNYVYNIEIVPIPNYSYSLILEFK